MRVQLQPAFVLHTRAYRDTSSLVELFTAEYGRLSVVARGVRRPSRKARQALQAFVPLLVSYSGRSELKTLAQWEAARTQAPVLRAERLYSGLYLNELLMRLMHRHDPHPALFADYGECLQRLAGDEDIEPVLRGFEYRLLDELGYGFSLTEDGRTGEPLAAEKWYVFDAEYGLVETAAVRNPQQRCYPGTELIALAEGHFSGGVKTTAKMLLRQALERHLGDRPLRSRELFRAGALNAPTTDTQVES